MPVIIKTDKPEVVIGIVDQFKLSGTPTKSCTVLVVMSTISATKIVKSPFKNVVFILRFQRSGRLAFIDD